MMGCNNVKLPARNYSLLGMQVSSMIAADTEIAPDGSVLGHLPYVENFEAFNKANPKEQEGNFLPVLITDVTGEKMTIKKNGSAAKNKKEMKFDPEIILRVENNETTFEVEVDGKPAFSLNFKKTKLVEK